MGKNLLVYRVDPENNLVYVKGAVPGPSKAWVRLTDAKNKKFDQPPPFPTAFRRPHEPADETVLFVPKPSNVTWDVEDLSSERMCTKISRDRSSLMTALQGMSTRPSVAEKRRRPERIRSSKCERPRRNNEKNCKRSVMSVPLLPLKNVLITLFSSMRRVPIS